MVEGSSSSCSSSAIFHDDIHWGDEMRTCLSFFSKHKAHSESQKRTDIVDEFSDIKNVTLYRYAELQIATEDFKPSNRIGRGGFGSVYKGMLRRDGTLVALKVLSAESTQGVREFLAEIAAISEIEHENLVKLHGCCIEGGHRVLVYGYLENNSLAQTLLGGNRTNIQFSWEVRAKICIGIARGLAFLHEDVQPHIVHRDIKASNILLDKDLTPKISDFGLAKLFPNNQTHVTTRVAGTLSYLAPEYAIRGQLTRKADIYSFGILLLEIVSGRRNTQKWLPVGEQYLLEKAWKHYTKGELMQLIDPSLGTEVKVEAAYRYLKIALLCTQEMPIQRPSMPTVVELLAGNIDLDDEQISKPGLLPEFLGLRGNKGGDASDSESPSLRDHNNSNNSMTFTSIDERSVLN